MYLLSFMHRSVIAYYSSRDSTSNEFISDISHLLVKNVVCLSTVRKQLFCYMARSRVVRSNIITILISIHTAGFDIVNFTPSTTRLSIHILHMAHFVLYIFHNRIAHDQLRLIGCLSRQRRVLAFVR